MDEANAILAQFPPTSILKEKENKRIKLYFEQGLPIHQIVQEVNLPKTEVLICLQEMGLVDSFNKSI